MAPTKRGKASASSRARPTTNGSPPAPFKTAPESLAVFYERLSPQHCYVAHIDTKPASFKRKIFSVPVVMNVCIVVLFAWRVWYIGPYYWQLVQTALGTANATTLVARDLTWAQLAVVVLRRGVTFMLDLVLAVFVWPWPVEFCFGTRHGNPVGWRLQVGFRDREIYVRRSRGWYAPAQTPDANKTATTAASSKTAPAPDLVNDDAGRRLLVAHLAQATSPMLLQQKTGYLTMDGNWDLDWDLMVWATHLVDTKALALEAFTTLVLLHHDDYGWLTLDRQGGDGPGTVPSAADDERRRQVFAFRDALVALGKEDLFYRWIEIIQFEVTRPGGIGDADRQAAVANQVREEFKAKDVDFDRLWAETVGAGSLFGM